MSTSLRIIYHILCSDWMCILPGSIHLFLFLIVSVWFFFFFFFVFFFFAFHKFFFSVIFLFLFQQKKTGKTRETIRELSCPVWISAVGSLQFDLICAGAASGGGGAEGVSAALETQSKQKQRIR